MGYKTNFNIDISPKNDLREVFVGDNKMFVNKDKTFCHTDEEVMCISKDNEDCSALDIYTRLLNITSYSEKIYKEVIMRKGHVSNFFEFRMEFMKKYDISVATFFRALNELRSRGIVIANNGKIDIVPIYNIYEATKEAKSILIILKTT